MTSKAESEKDDCNDPDADINCSFVHMPASLSSIMNIAGKEEPGDKMIVSGTLLKSDGKTPYPDVIFYAYHTDSKGYYSKNGKEKGVQKWHGHLHGWCKTDRNGRYEIRTIRPAPYPNNKIPAHVHAAVKVPGKPSPYYITDFVFSDDPMINEQYRESIKGKTGGTGIVDLVKDGSVWKGKRDIILEP
ncbi:intradiol ring-cleavage dioxygenase [Flavihumibacter sp. R14]|nr:intradiol ring-cleavage dioxygenase [Flavihumibacter soli]